jgi:hypothetical protein
MQSLDRVACVVGVSYGGPAERWGGGNDGIGGSASADRAELILGTCQDSR